jgi:hypothetical protein
VQNYCVLKIKRYICKVNKAQQLKKRNMRTITLNEKPTMLINGKQSILTGEYVFIGFTTTQGDFYGQMIVMDAPSGEIFILQ